LGKNAKFGEKQKLLKILEADFVDPCDYHKSATKILVTLSFTNSHVRQDLGVSIA